MFLIKRDYLPLGITISEKKTNLRAVGNQQWTVPHCVRVVQFFRRELYFVSSVTSFFSEEKIYLTLDSDAFFVIQPGIPVFQ